MAILYVHFILMLYSKLYLSRVPNVKYNFDSNYKFVEGNHLLDEAIVLVTNCIFINGG